MKNSILSHLSDGPKALSYLMEYFVPPVKIDNLLDEVLKFKLALQELKKEGLIQIYPTPKGMYVKWSFQIEEDANYCGVIIEDADLYKLITDYNCIVRYENFALVSVDAFDTIVPTNDERLDFMMEVLYGRNIQYIILRLEPKTPPE